MKGFFVIGLLLSPILAFNQAKSDSLQDGEIQEVILLKKLPVAKEIIHVKKDLDAKNLGQDLPILLKNQTSIISTSDAGNGVGYTGFRIRGVGGTSINVMMNGVPFNDSESQGTFFVNVPDLTSSSSQIVIQRGVGTSSNGVSAFGATVNIISKDPDSSFYGRSDFSFGSFNTYKYSAEIGSGSVWKNRWSFSGRFTKIHSDGYIDRAFSNLQSYHLSALFKEGKTNFRFMAFGGKEKTYQAWNGIDTSTWETNPRFNYSGAIYDENWERIVGFYGNETDNYRQNHYQLVWKQNLNANWNLETTMHYTKGKGYYENYKQKESFATYNLPDQNGSLFSDFIRKKWLDNDFYGTVSTLYGKFENVEFNFGAVANQYYGRHFGNSSAVEIPSILEHEYYRNRSIKNEISGFAKMIFRWKNVEFFGDLQLRNISYDTKVLLAGDDEGGNLDKKWSFFNPKAGISYRIQQGKVFLSYANAHREPNRDDLLANHDTQPESLHDFEAGVEKNVGKWTVSANLYYMYYVNQLVLSGAINNVGEFIRTNSGKSYRSGIELGARSVIANKWMLSGNMTLSNNKNIDYKVENSSGITILGDTKISFSPQIIGNILLEYQPIKKMSLSVQNQYVGSQYLDNTNSENLKLKNYFLTDINAKYSIALHKTQLDFKVLVNNIFNKKYVNNGYVWDGPVYYAQAGTNILCGVSFLFQ